MILENQDLKGWYPWLPVTKYLHGSDQKRVGLVCPCPTN